MNIERLLVILHNIAPQLNAKCVGNMVAGDFETQLADGGVINFVNDEKGWTLAGPVGIGFSSGITIENLKTETDLVKAIKRSYIPQMHVYNLKHGYPISLPTETGNFYWDFLYYASWALYGLNGAARQAFAHTILLFLDVYNKDFQKTARGYFERFKLEIE
jgi:hypothetical protein